MIGELQYTEIYVKLKRRNKLWASDKFSYNKVENNTNNYYLCGGKFNINEFDLHGANHSTNREKRADRH